MADNIATGLLAPTIRSNEAFQSDNWHGIMVPDKYSTRASIYVALLCWLRLARYHVQYTVSDTTRVATLVLRYTGESNILL